MKIIAKVLFAVLVLAVSIYSPVIAQSLYYNPECVVFDYDYNRYLVANYANGTIIEVDSAGEQSYFAVGLGHCLGMHILDDVLYVSCYTSLVGLHLSSGDTAMCMTMPLAGHLDGMTADDAGYLYVIDTGGRILKVNPNEQTHSVFLDSGLPLYPQDCVYDPDNNRLLVAVWATNAPVYAVDLADSTLSIVASTNFGRFDGIARDRHGNVYLASHYAEGRIYRFEGTFTEPPELISSGHAEPAGLFFNNQDDILAIPNFGSHTVDFLPMTVSIQERGDDGNGRSYRPTEYTVLDIYPNPFNSSATIYYTLAKPTDVQMEIFDILGGRIEAVVDEFQPAGQYSLIWNTSGVSSGTYFCKLRTNDYSNCRKMILLK